MTVNDLVEYLETTMKNKVLDGEEDICVAISPDSPRMLTLADSVTKVRGTVYLAEDQRRGYLPSDVREAIGWQ